MRFGIPGMKTKHTIRLFERVETVDNQYDIFDIGVETPDGVIDSIVIGGAFSSAKQWLATEDKAEAPTEATLKVAEDASEQSAAA